MKSRKAYKLCLRDINREINKQYITSDKDIFNYCLNIDDDAAMANQLSSLHYIRRYLEEVNPENIEVIKKLKADILWYLQNFPYNDDVYELLSLKAQEIIADYINNGVF